MQALQSEGISPDSYFDRDSIANPPVDPETISTSAECKLV